MNYPACADFPKWAYIFQRRNLQDAQARREFLEERVDELTKTKETALHHIRNAITIVDTVRQEIDLTGRAPTLEEQIAQDVAVLARLKAAERLLEQGGQ